ncbi:MAG: IS21-like element helper ATPase IstB [Bullifex sp.]
MENITAEKRERLRRNMRFLMLSNQCADDACTKSTPKVLDFLDRIFTEEAARRQASRIANIIRSAGFPGLKDIGDYDFSQLKMPSSMTREELLNLDFMDRKENLIMYGVCGSGKTMLSICLGMLACRSGRKVHFYTLAELAARLKEASEDGRLENFLMTLRKLDLLIIDEWGYTMIDKESAEYVFRVIGDSYEKKSLIITTNLPFSEWGRIVTDEQLAAAIIDRIVHYGHNIDTGSRDWRLVHSPMNRQSGVTVREEH